MLCTEHTPQRVSVCMCVYACVWMIKTSNTTAAHSSAQRKPKMLREINLHFSIKECLSLIVFVKDITDMFRVRFFCPHHKYKRAATVCSELNTFNKGWRQQLAFKALLKGTAKVWEQYRAANSITEITNQETAERYKQELHWVYCKDKLLK